MNCRLICFGDYFKGYLSLMSQLSKVTYDISTEEFKQALTDSQDTIYVCECDGKIVGNGKLIVEKKIHCPDPVGHIEDIVVDKDYRRMGIGSKIVMLLLDESMKYKCYKTILNCSSNNVKFYEKMGFYNSGSEMRNDLK